MESVSCCKRNGGCFSCRSRCHIPSWEDDGLGRCHTTNSFLQQRQCLPNLGEIDTAHCSGKQKGTGRFSGCGGRQSAEEGLAGVVGKLATTTRQDAACRLGVGGPAFHMKLARTGCVIRGTVLLTVYAHTHTHTPKSKPAIAYTG